MPRRGPWIQDPDVVINATTPAEVHAALVAAGNGSRSLDDSEPFRHTTATGQLGGDTDFFPGVSTFDAVCEGAPESPGPVFPRPAGLAAVWSENDTLDATELDTAFAFRFPYDPSNPAVEPFLPGMPADDQITGIGTPVERPFGTGVDNIIVGASNTILDINLFWLIDWDLPTSSHWPDTAIDIEMDPAREDSIYDGGLIGDADIGLRFTNKTVDHYGFFRYWPWNPAISDYDETRFRWHSTASPAGVGGADTFELRLAPADLPVGFGTGSTQPMVSATQLAAWTLLADEAIAPIHPTAPSGHVTGTGYLSPYDYTNAADQAPFDLAVTIAGSMGPRVVCALASQRTKTQPDTPAMGELIMQDDVTTPAYRWQTGQVNFTAVDVSPDGHTVQSVQLTWRPPRYRFIYEGGRVPLRQRQTSTGIHTGGATLRHRQHTFGLRQRQTGI